MSLFPTFIVVHCRTRDRTRIADPSAQRPHRRYAEGRCNLVGHLLNIVGSRHGVKSNAVINVVKSIPVVYIVKIVSCHSVKYTFIGTNIHFAEEQDPWRVLSLSGYLSDESGSSIDLLIDDRGDDLAEKMFVVSFDDEETFNNEETRHDASGDVTTDTDSPRDKHMAA